MIWNLRNIFLYYLGLIIIKIMGVKLVGDFNLNVKGKKVQFAALEIERLIGASGVVTESSLNDAEVVIYAYILMAGYRKSEKRVIFDESIRYLASVLTISKQRVQNTLKSLAAKGLLKKIKAGYAGITSKKKQRYLVVMKPFLLSTVLSTSQKAFLLRLAALQEGGYITGEEVTTNTELSDRLNITTKTIATTLKKLHATDVSWMKIVDDKLIIDYYMLKVEVADNLADRVEGYERDIDTRLQLEFRVNTTATRKPSKKKSGLILQLDELRKNPAADMFAIGVAVKYLNQSRLTLAINILDKEEERLSKLKK